MYDFIVDYGLLIGIGDVEMNEMWMDPIQFEMNVCG